MDNNNYIPKGNYIRRKEYNPGLFWKTALDNKRTGYNRRTGFILGINDRSTNLSENLRTGQINFRNYTLNYAAAAAKGFKELPAEELENQHNCDILAIAKYTKGCVLALLDGVGNLQSTQIHCENLANAVIDPKFDFEARTDADFENSRIEADTCACISMVQISDKLQLSETHAGDTITMIFRYQNNENKYNIGICYPIDNIAGEQFENGIIDHSQYNEHTERNYITNGIAVNDIDAEINFENRPMYPGLRPPSKNQELNPNDIVLMCSDGIYDNLTEEEILEIVNKHQAQGPEAILRAISEAQYNRVTFKATKEKRNDGYTKRAKQDNVSAICLRIEGKGKVNN